MPYLLYYQDTRSSHLLMVYPSYASKVYIIHRRSEFRACQEDLMRAITNPKIEFLTNYEIAEAHGKDNLESLTLQSVMTGEKRNLPVRAPCSG